MTSGSQPDRDRRSSTRSADVRRRALQQTAATGGDAVERKASGWVRLDERRRYVFQVWTCAAFAAVWLLVAVLSGSWLFVVLAVGFTGLAGLAAASLVVLRRRESAGAPPSDGSP